MMEKSQKAYEDFQDVIRAELLRKLESGELTEDDIIQLKKEKVIDNATVQ